MNQPQSFGILGPDEFRKIRELFESAIELAPAERARLSISPVAVIST